MLKYADHYNFLGRTSFMHGSNSDSGAVAGKFAIRQLGLRKR